MTKYKVQNLRSLREEMKAVARGARSASRCCETELQFGRCPGAAVDPAEPTAPCDHSGSEAPIGCRTRRDERARATEPHAHTGQDGVRRFHHDEDSWPPQGTERRRQEGRGRDRSLLGPRPTPGRIVPNRLSTDSILF